MTLFQRNKRNRVLVWLAQGLSLGPEAWGINRSHTGRFLVRDKNSESYFFVRFFGWLVYISVACLKLTM